MCKWIPGGSAGKESACNAGVRGSIPGLGRFLWRREQLPTLVFLPGESQGQRSLASYSPLGCKELDTTEVTEHTQHMKFEPFSFLQFILITTILMNLFSFLSFFFGHATRLVGS